MRQMSAQELRWYVLVKNSSSQKGGQDQWLLTTSSKENTLQRSFWGLICTYDTPPVHPYCPLVHLAFRGCCWEQQKQGAWDSVPCMSQVGSRSAGVKAAAAACGRGGAGSASES